MRDESEARIAAAVVAWLEHDGWDVYQEVQFGANGRIADIVAVRGPVSRIVEAKVSMGLKLIAQGLGWAWRANQVWIATPTPKGLDSSPREPGERRPTYRESLRGSRERDDAQTVLDCTPLGWLMVEKDGRVKVRRPAEFSRLNPTMARDLRERLMPEHKTHAAAGTTGEGIWSEFKATCEKLAKLVAERPGVALNEAIADLEHHYANDKSARGSLLHWIDRGKVAGVVALHDGRSITLWPPGAAQAPQGEAQASLGLG